MTRNRKNKSKGKRGGEKEPAPKAVAVRAPQVVGAQPVGVRAQPPAQPVVGAQAPAQPPLGVRAQPPLGVRAQPPLGVRAQPPLGPAPAQPVVGAQAQAQAQPAPDAPKLSFLEKMKALNPGAVVTGKLTGIEAGIQAKHAEFGKNLAAKQAEITGNVQEKINGFNNRFMQLLPTGGKSKKRARRTKKRARRTKKRSRSSTRRGSAPARHSRGSATRTT